MLGIDIEQNSRFNDWEKEKLKRIFTDNEIKYATEHNKIAQHFCGFYCVKEAFVKASSNKKIAYKKIEVLHDNSNKPYINLNKEINSILKNLNKSNIEVSISHTDEYSVAIVQLN